MNTFWHDLPRPFFVLAPMEAVTDVVFRHVVAKAAPPDVWFTEFTNATGWVHGGQKAIGGRLVKTDDEQPIVAQIWGGEPGDMEELARHCAELGFHGIDINMGCPAKSAIKSGGSALILQPELAAQAIAAAKTSGLPVSVKTRLGYTHIDEWRDWITHILKQDIVNFTIHLRTKKEMSKVPAHHELIGEIKKLRDEIAPHTLLTINGDIRDRQHGLELVEKYGVDGVMIGRGIFANPFAFAHVPQKSDLTIAEGVTQSEVQPEKVLTQSETFPQRNGDSESENQNREQATSSVDNGEYVVKRIELLKLQLDLYDTYSDQTGRPFDTLKRFFKIYIRDFEGASELRDKLMHTKNTDEVRALIATIG